MSFNNNGLHSDWICREYDFKVKFEEMLKMFVSPISFLVGKFKVTVAA